MPRKSIGQGEGEGGEGGWGLGDWEGMRKIIKANDECKQTERFIHLLFLLLRLLAQLLEYCSVNIK